jgi:hypothetical protein
MYLLAVALFRLTAHNMHFYAREQLPHNEHKHNENEGADSGKEFDP